MKGFLIAFLLLASVFFLPSSTLARQLYEKAVDATPVTPGTGDPNKPAIKCDPGKPYSECLKPKTPPKRQ
ncbi:hypothetical protein Fmac_011496 [Flemingia macrophylla]|uniref:Uncharacterized protein n=1 Tax=Flemingia macrophylla TaxID=520843 RepID=A0ABD1MML3_9FABA